MFLPVCGYFFKVDNKNWQSLDHYSYRFLQLFLQNHSTLNRHWILAVSGGVDSMVMLTVLSKLISALDLRLSVVHIHHGPSADTSISDFRHKARACVQERCEQLAVEFLTNTIAPEMELASEQDFRDFRYQQIFQFCSAKKASVLFLAHQQEDLIETMMMRLIRGADLPGMIAMRPQQLEESHNIYKLRPFLQTTKAEIMAYAEAEKIKFVQDPSNQMTDYFRNWLRHHWLPQLDQFQPGALNSLSRSLLNLQSGLLSAEAEKDARVGCAGGLPCDLWCQVDGVGLISRPVFLTLSREQKMQCLALYIRQCAQNSFTQNHLQEILKHLDKQQNVHTFRAAQLDWAITAEYISAKKCIFKS